MFGYTGKLLFVDLTAATTEIRDLDETTARNFVGGPALGAKILYDEMPPNVHAFSEESMLGFVSGPANGTGAFLGGRYTVVSKSPVTGGWNDANSGGNFGPMMRRAGFDGIFVKGISEKPVYIYVDNGTVSLRDATHLWGKTTEKTEKLLKEELGDNRICAALIGPAGERKSYMAAVMNDTHRAAGRGGSGAVMGSKNLKAVVVRGETALTPKDRDGVVALNKEVAAWHKEGPTAPLLGMFMNNGTGGFYEGSVLSGDACVKNWAGWSGELTEEQIKALTAARMDSFYKKKKYACNACPIGCGAIYEIKDDRWPVEETGRPEYETLGMFGSSMLNGDAASVNMCNWLANEYGYDVISLGATVTWLMECYNNGVFSLEELDGIDLKWGNAEAIVEMTKRICEARGIGEALNYGSQGAAKHFGKGVEALVVANGIEIPQHDARYGPGLARTYQYDPTPGRHVKGGLGVTSGNEPPEVKYNYSDTGARDLAGVVRQEIINNAGFCMFTDFGFPGGIEVRFLNAITGFAYSDDDARNLGIRSFTMRHAFNLREGMLRKDFTISDRIVGKPPLNEGPLAGVTVDNEQLADNFFAVLGWNIDDAVPGLETLRQVGGLDNIIRDLYPDSRP